MSWNLTLKPAPPVLPPCLLASLPACLYPSSMRTSPRKLLGETDLYTAAINGLARRAYSVHDMRVYLEKRAEDKEAVGAIMTRLKDHKYVDDARYARQFVRLR